jgi:hypothetical protein
MIKTKLDTFDRDILFFFWDYKKVIKFALKEEVYDPELFEINPELSQWRTMVTSKWFVICWVKHKTAHHFIAHEIFHCAEFILRQVWITLSEDSDEVYAYSIQSITEQLYSKLK